MSREKEVHQKEVHQTIKEYGFTHLNGSVTSPNFVPLNFDIGGDIGFRITTTGRLVTLELNLTFDCTADPGPINFFNLVINPLPLADSTSPGPMGNYIPTGEVMTILAVSGTFIPSIARLLLGDPPTIQVTVPGIVGQNFVQVIGTMPAYVKAEI